jgi:hypothetical protein
MRGALTADRNRASPPEPHPLTVLLNVIGTIVVMVSMRRARMVPTALVAVAIMGSLLFWNPSDAPSQKIRIAGELLRLSALGWAAMRFRRQPSAAMPLPMQTTVTAGPPSARS